MVEDERQYEIEPIRRKESLLELVKIEASISRCAS